MGGASLPPGFRFHPTDEELVGYYLHRKVQGLEIELEVIPVLELYKFDPWELPEKSFLPKRDMEWFFFCPRDRKYPNGTRTNRATKAGYWKATGKDRKVVCQSSVTGYRKTLVFYCGRAPLGDRTDWVMHEYRLFDESSQSQGAPNFQGAYALCRVIKKNEQAHKASDSHGESKAMRIGNNSSIGDLTTTGISNEPLGISADIPSQTSYSCNNSHYSSPIASPFQVGPVAEYELASIGNPSNIQDYPQVQEAMSGYFPLSDYVTSISPWQPKEHREFSPGSSYSNFRGDVEPADALGHAGYMSPYLGNEDYMDLCGNEDVSYHGYDYANNF